MKLETNHIETGQIGEEIAVNFLISKGFSIVQRNFRTKFGEIDIIAKKENSIRFFEVKTVSCEPNNSEIEKFQPEENVTRSKVEKLKKTIEIYFTKQKIDLEGEWGIDVLAITIDRKGMKARIKMIENISFD